MITQTFDACPKIMSTTPTGNMTSYRPDESDLEVFSEHIWLQGAFLGAMAYGMQFIVYCMTFHLLWRRRKHSPSTSRGDIGRLIYITLTFTCCTLYIISLLAFTQQAFIDGRNIPGGPSAYEIVMFSIPIDMLGNAGFMMLSWVCDVINVSSSSDVLEAHFV
jgi:amino acid transporter